MDEDLLRAFATLDLAPGANWAQVLARYRQLAKNWHPDRFRSLDEKRLAEEKIKKIIAAREMLQAHYLSREHLEALCLCAAAAAKRNENEAAAAAKEDAAAKPDSAPKPKPPPEEWDWLSALCKNLDLGEVTGDEPGWYETTRRVFAKIYGKHPDETIIGTWEKPVQLTKEHKKRCLIFTLFVIIAFDRLALAIDPQAFRGGAENHSAEKAILERATAEEHAGEKSVAKTNAQIREETREEIEKERQYFEQRWQQRQRPLSPP